MANNFRYGTAMAKDTRVARTASAGKFIGVSTSSDVRAFRDAARTLAASALSQKQSAKSLVDRIEKRSGLNDGKKPKK
jgi:hypothetical protein